MALRPLKSFFSNADELLRRELPTLGETLLVHLNSYEDRVKQHAGLNRGHFRAMLENRNVGLGPLPSEPEYGTRQPEVTERMMEAWNLLEREGLLIRNDQQPAGDWFVFSTEGKNRLQRLGRYEHWERLGLERVKADLVNTGGLRDVGGPPEAQDMAWEWVREKENKPPIKNAPAAAWMMVAESRLAELRALKSSKFDFKRLIRLCEELNIASREDCLHLVSMGTRAVLDHVPPVFGVRSFSEIANNYIGGSKSFKDTMQHLDTAAKKIADGFLHTQIRKNESLPTAQQVNFAAALDLLLGEIVRITQ
ncbi:MAG TPA: hypothetical protein VH351_03570 [Bryobacteraceae bacterium]|jgi:hypothetical protein|nr:hypothetical protein [Bryobacteraceae bacterium]